MLRGDVSLGFPVIEWATWWDQTVNNWAQQGVAVDDLESWFGLDVHRQIWIRPRARGCPGPAYHGGPIITEGRSYDDLRPFL